MRTLVFTALSVMSLILTATLAQAQYDDSFDRSSPEYYDAAQLLDGFGAILVGAGEPIFFPIDQAQRCKRDGNDSLTSGGCALLGVIGSPFLVVRDVLVGAGDILTFGYFKISRRVGVFDYFNPEQPVERTIERVDPLRERPIERPRLPHANDYPPKREPYNSPY